MFKIVQKKINKTARPVMYMSRKQIHWKSNKNLSKKKYIYIKKVFSKMNNILFIGRYKMKWNS